jgi:hypothetical protein
MSRRLLIFDALSLRFHSVKLRGRAAGCAACGETAGSKAEGVDVRGAGEGEGKGKGEDGSGSGSGKAENGMPRGSGNSSGRATVRDAASLAAYDYAAFTGQAASDGPPTPLTLIPRDQRITAAQLKERWVHAGVCHTN